MYLKQTWKNGDIITEDKLNHMEEGISTGGGIYTYGEVSLFDGSVTTTKASEDAVVAQASITLQGDLSKSDISVTFNGQNYTLPYGNIDGGDYWGELDDSTGIPVFTNYPVFVYEDGIITSEAGTYSLKINDQKLEVNESIESALRGLFITTVNNGILNKTFKEIMNANKTCLVIIKSFSELEDTTEVVLDVNAETLELISIGYISTSVETDITHYRASTLIV